MKEWIIPSLILGIILIVVEIFSSFRRNKKTNLPEEKTNDKAITESSYLPYYRKKYIFSSHEYYFYKELKIVADSMELLIFPKMRLADIVGIQKNEKNYQSWFNRIKAKHIDFTLCSAKTLIPQILIELDDKSHDNTSRKERDTFVDAISKSINLPILHIRQYTKESLINNINIELQKKPLE